ncbi:MAG: YegS/Rv2252/BmrU family lipid kinase [Flavisolibacter sp.]|nr:YegS/Rv2252/BmrU family lipid kinase [Flavisolibacter sp.]
MQRKLLYIINPISGTRNKESLQEVIKRKSEAAGFSFQIFPSVASGDYSFLIPVIQEQNITDVVIAGGDGTINQVVNSLKSCNVQFGIIPCGSGNGLAFSAGLPKNWNKALDIIFRGKSAWTDAFTVNGQFACMLCGLGFDAQVAYDFANDPGRGLRTYIKQSVRNFLAAKAYPFVLITNNHSWETEAFFISIANSNQFGNKVTIAPQASLTDGLLDVVVVTKQNKVSVLLNTVKQVAGYNKPQQIDELKERANVLYLQTPAIEIKNKHLAPMHIDGEPVAKAKKISIVIQPRSFRLIYP